MLEECAGDGRRFVLAPTDTFIGRTPIGTLQYGTADQPNPLAVEATGDASRVWDPALNRPWMETRLELFLRLAGQPIERMLLG